MYGTQNILLKTLQRRKEYLMKGNMLRYTCRFPQGI